jgi:transcription initiation factor IIE alpha subunit
MSDTEPRSRREDPRTSYKAASEALKFYKTHRGMIYAVFEAQPARGFTNAEIGLRCGLNQNQVSRRLTELERLGLIHRTGETRPNEGGRDEEEWRLGAANYPTKTGRPSLKALQEENERLRHENKVLREELKREREKRPQRSLF